MESGERTRGIIVRKFLRAALFFGIIAVVIPVSLGMLAGKPAGSMLGLITSTFVLQAGAPMMGVAIGLPAPVILLIMACFALGMVLAIFEICDSLSTVSPRVQRWLKKIEKEGEKYPGLRHYGVLSCFLIAWIPPFGIYGAPVFAWIMNWKRWHSVAVIVTSFFIASVFVLFFASKITQILFFAANAGVVIFIISSMVTLGLSNSVAGIRAAAADRKFIFRLLFAGIVLVPALALVLATVLNLSMVLTGGMVLLGTAAGSPFLPRAAQVPAGKRALAGAAGVLLTIVSVLYIPVAGPFLMPGESHVNYLVLLAVFAVIILVPLLATLCIKPGTEEEVAALLPWADRVSYGALFLAFIGVVYVFSDRLVAILWWQGLAAIIALPLLAFCTGCLLAGRGAGMREVFAFGTAQRNLAVALVLPIIDLISGCMYPETSPYDPDLLLFILTAAIACLLILLAFQKARARRGKRAA